MNRSGTFQERLEAAVSLSQKVTIERHDVEGGEDYFSIEVESDTGDFGKLTGSVDLNITDATPGKLVAAIEDTAGVITSAIEVMRKRPPESVTAPEPVL